MSDIPDLNLLENSEGHDIKLVVTGLVRNCQVFLDGIDISRYCRAFTITSTIDSALTKITFEMIFHKQKGPIIIEGIFISNQPELEEIIANEHRILDAVRGLES
jgi:hypothetical protein